MPPKMAPPKKKGKDATGWQAQVYRYAQTAYQGGKATAIAVFAPSVHAYFWWSSLFYATCAIYLAVERWSVNEFFCSVEPHGDSDGKGCTNCPSDLLLCEKTSHCYRNAVNITYELFAADSGASFYQSFIQASTDLNCNDYVRAGTDIVEVLEGIAAAEGSSTAAGDGCKDFWCKVFRTALENSDLYSSTGTCTNNIGTKIIEEADVCVCNDLVNNTNIITSAAYTDINTVCNSFMDNLCAADSSWRFCEYYTGRRRLEDEEALLANATVEDKEAPPDPKLCVEKAADEVPARVEGADESNDTVERRLTAPDFTVSDWSKCTCYQQCIPGVRERTVECLAAACSGSEPEHKEACECEHCADCIIDTHLFVLMATFSVQACIAFLAFLCYLYVSAMKEENLVKVSILKKIIGFICKRLPPLVKYIVLANCISIIIIAFRIWVPQILNVNWASADCFASLALRQTAIVLICFWVAQVFLTQLAKTYTRKPPWLYTPDRTNWPAAIRHIRYFIRGLGP